MSNNVVIKGFNSLRKLITRGYSELESAIGISVRICRLSNQKFIDLKVYTKSFISQSVKTR